MNFSLHFLLTFNIFLALLTNYCDGGILVKRGAALAKALHQVCVPNSRGCNGGSSSSSRSPSTVSRSSSRNSNGEWSDSGNETSSGSEDHEAAKKPKGAKHVFNHWEKDHSVEAFDGKNLRTIKLNKPIKDHTTPNDLQKWSGTYTNSQGKTRKTKVWQQHDNGMAQLAPGSTPRSRIFDPLNPSSPHSQQYPMSPKTKNANNQMKVFQDRDEKRENVRQRRKAMATNRQPYSRSSSAGSSFRRK